MSYYKMRVEIYKATKGMVEIKKSVDEETFNKMFEIFNDKHPEIEIMKTIDNVCIHSYDILFYNTYELCHEDAIKHEKLKKECKLKK